MKILKKLLEQIDLTNRRQNLFHKKDSLLLAVSGGSDSLALLVLLDTLKNKYRWRLAVAHVDHGLQRNRRQAQRIVEQYCRERALPFYSKKVNLRASAKRHKISLEDAGRFERYRFFEQTAGRLGADKIVTAHTADDQAETVLMRLFRGAGFRGLSGIPFKRRSGGHTLVRPLLACSKKDLTALLKERRLPFVPDPSNRDVQFLRNRVRHQLLPMLRRSFNPRVDEQLISLQNICRDVQRLIDKQAARHYARCVLKSNAREVRFKLRTLDRLDPAIESEVILLALSHLKGDGAGFGYSHIQAILDLVRSGRPEAQTHLPHGLRAVKTKQELRLQKTIH